MLCETLDRVSTRLSEKIYQPARIIGSSQFKALITEQSRASTTDVDRIILEPCMRDTCAAVAASIVDLANAHPNQIVLVLPSDHHVSDITGFNAVVNRAARSVANDGSIMTIGIKPNRPETQFGYIERAEGPGPIYDVARFREKPDIAAAKAYLALGTYFWNAGIFMFRVKDMAEEFERQQPKIWQSASLAVADGKIEQACLALEQTNFEACNKISIDYGIMENAKLIRTIQAAFDWSDLGSWNQLHETAQKDNKGNVILGDVVSTGVYNSYIRVEDRPAAIAGLDDIVVVSQPDALMVVHREKSYLVKDLHSMVSKTDWPPKTTNMSGKQIPYVSQIHDWVFNHALPYWALKGIDYENGGVHEALDYDGRPVDLGHKRLRVLARQIYSYAQAHMLGWDGNCEKILDHLVDTLINTGWHQDGGFIHLFNLDGTVQNDSRDAYDQCFVLLAFANLWAATKSPLAMEWGKKTLKFMDEQLADQDRGGFFETMERAGQRRTNPHMHFFEAMIAWFEATGEQPYLDRAAEIVALFKSKFFDHENWRLHEFFDADWHPLDNEVNLVEPGHHYEWVWLLLRYAKLSGDHSLKDYARKLYATALSFGHYQKTDAVALKMQYDGSHLSDTGRMWCQTEALKAALAMKEHGMALDGNLATRMLDQIFNRYLNTPQYGGWYDAANQDGLIVSTNMPTSTLYHVLCAFAEYLRLENNGAHLFPTEAR